MGVEIRPDQLDVVVHSNAANVCQGMPLLNVHPRWRRADLLLDLLPTFFNVTSHIWV